MRRSSTLALFLLMGVLPENLPAALIEDDSSRPEMELTRIAFGSCSKQRMEQRLWPAINNARPQVWLWTGDAVYLDVS